MKLNEFLEILTAKQKINYLTGAALDTIRNRLTHHENLKIYRAFLNDTQQMSFEIEFTKKELWLSKGDIHLALRKGSTDLEVFKQVFIRNEYLPLIDCALANNITIKTIIDAGANIGLTSVKLLDRFPQARVICLEPDPGNFKQLQHNLKPYAQRGILLSSAIWYREEELFLSNDFRGGQEWSRSVTASKTGESAVKGTSLNTIVTEHQLTEIDILKIDIEGSEAAIFKPENDLSFLDITKIIALEIHDEFNCRETIYGLLREHGFVLFNGVELTLGVNMKLLGIEFRKPVLR